MKQFVLLGIGIIAFIGCSNTEQNDSRTSHTTDEQMMFGDTTRLGRPFSKDPDVVKFHDHYLMYYSIPPASDKKSNMKGWGIGIAKSTDLVHWKRTGEIKPEFDYEKKGLCAPGAIVRNDTVHIFYQTYGNGKEDAICHAYSTDGIHFTKDKTNPVFSPTGNWTVGRAIDAEVAKFKGRYYLYFATRDSTMHTQMQGVAVAKGKSFAKGEWVQKGNSAILRPKYPWEGNCVEGASIIQHGGRLYMFYAGAYNNVPQQIGVAKSDDAIHWQRISNKPFLANGDPGDWNASESGHPHIFEDTNGRTYLFYQGNNDNGHTWYISKTEIGWNDKGPYLK